MDVLIKLSQFTHSSTTQRFTTSVFVCMQSLLILGCYDSPVQHIRNLSAYYNTLSTHVPLSMHATCMYMYMYVYLHAHVWYIIELSGLWMCTALATGLSVV